MKIEVHILSHDEEQMQDWAERHYKTFADRIYIWHGGPRFNARTRMEYENGCVIEVMPWDTAGELNDELAMKLKNSCWKGTDADVVIVVDCDELIYFPDGARKSLEAYDARGACVLKPQGFEMFWDLKFPEIGDVQMDHYDGEGKPVMYPIEQIYDIVKDGAPENKWYSKPVVFFPKRVVDAGFGIGAHESNPVMKGGKRVYVGQDWPIAVSPPVYLLHFHHIGPIERVAARYDATRLRLSRLNEQRKFGNFDPGLQHAQDKRALILPHLQRVIA